MEYKKFRSPSKDIRISGLSGHTVIITSELTLVPDVLWGQAYSLGAISEDMQVSSMSSYLAEKEKEIEIEKEKEREELKGVLENIFKNPVGFVDKQNRPVVRKVLGVINKPIKKDVIDSIWDEIVKEQSEE